MVQRGGLSVTETSMTVAGREAYPLAANALQRNGGLQATSTTDGCSRTRPCVDTDGFTAIAHARSTSRRPNSGSLLGPVGRGTNRREGHATGSLVVPE
jgi:hypothetical protein